MAVLYNTVCVGPGRKTRRQFFFHNAVHLLYLFRVEFNSKRFSCHNNEVNLDLFPWLYCSGLVYLDLFPGTVLLKVGIS